MTAKKQTDLLNGHLNGIRFALAKLVVELGEKGALDDDKYVASMLNNAVAYRPSEPQFSDWIEHFVAEVKNLKGQGRPQ